MISLTKLSEIFSKISDDHKIVINLDDLRKSFPELSYSSNNLTNNLNVCRCLALMSKGDRCTRKPKRDGLCGIHLNMLEKNGTLPNGKSKEDNNNGAIGQSSSDLVSVSDLKSKSGKANKSSQSSKSNKKNKKKIDKDVETDDSDLEEDNIEEDNLPKIKSNKKKLDNAPICRKVHINETLEDNNLHDLDVDEDNLTKKKSNKKTPENESINRKTSIIETSKSDNSDDSDDSETSENKKILKEDDNEEKINYNLKKEIEKIVKEIVKESNYDKCKSFSKKVKDILSSRLSSECLSDSKFINQLIKSRLETEFNSYDSKLKEDIKENEDDYSSDNIDCILIKKNNKVYALDEKTSIVYDVNSHAEIGVLKNDVIVYLD